MSSSYKNINGLLHHKRILKKKFSFKEVVIYKKLLNLPLLFCESLSPFFSKWFYMLYR